MKKLVYLLLAIGLLFNCQMPLSNMAPSTETSNGKGSIQGFAYLDNTDTHEGIIITVEKRLGVKTETISRSLHNDELDSSRALSSNIEASTTTDENGFYSIDGLEEGTYTIYATSADAAEKAVSTDTVVRNAQTVTAAEMNLVTVGQISGRVIINKTDNDNLGYMVFVAGTSYMAMTDDSGRFVISDVPVGIDYHTVIAQGEHIVAWDKIDVIAGETSELRTAYLLKKNDILSVIDAFCSYWSTNLAGLTFPNLNNAVTNANQIKLPFVGYESSTGITVDWGDGTLTTISSQELANGSSKLTHTYPAEGRYLVSILGDLTSFGFQGGGDRVKLSEIVRWGNFTIGSVSGQFNGCFNLKITALDKPLFTKCNNLQNTFAHCLNLNGIPFINEWNVSGVTRMNGTFNNAHKFNDYITGWNVSKVSTMENMFNGAKTFNQPIGVWNVGNVTNMKNMFLGASAFNQPLDNWNVSKVTNMMAMFKNAVSFNRWLGKWNVSNVGTMESMFEGATAFNKSIASWNVGNVSNMKGMFKNARSFNQPLNEWQRSIGLIPMGTRFVTNMSSMFEGASAFNQPLNNWRVDNVQNMSSMFKNATSFNQSLSSWSVSKVTNMSGMFAGANLYNKPLNSWDVFYVKYMDDMFANAASFNQPLNNWKPRNIESIDRMFNGAVRYVQNIDSWNIAASVDKDDTFVNSGLEGSEPTWYQP